MMGEGKRRAMKEVTGVVGTGGDCRGPRWSLRSQSGPSKNFPNVLFFEKMLHTSTSIKKKNNPHNLPT